MDEFETVASFIIKVMSSSCFTLVQFCFNAINNGSFLSGEEVTIFEGHIRRDSDSWTHP